MTIKLLTDSTSDISQAEGKSRGITVIPLKITFGGETFHDNITISHNEFFNRLTASTDLPTTSQPTPEDFLPAFESAKANGDALICIMLSSGLSGTVQSALIAKEMCAYNHIYVIDSLQAVAGLRLLVDLADYLIKEGRSAPEIVAEIESARKKVKLHAVIDTLTYLHKGGRLSSAVTMVGTLMKVKPLLTLKDGVLSITGKGMGTKDGNAKSLKMMTDLPEADPRLPIYFGYTQNKLPCDKFQALAVATYGITRMESHSVGGVIGTHIGPNATFCTYLTK